jgi:mannose-6-phosphate isomerase-like protein (cupin superfamily)
VITSKKIVVHEDEGSRSPDICGMAIELINEETSFPKNISTAIIIIDIGKSSEAHYHKITEEIYFIMEGDALLEIDNMKFKLRSGHSAIIPIGTVHRIKNTGQIQLKFLSIDSPIYDPNDVFRV